MYTPATLQFLRDLKENNNREWFEANKNRYEAARANHLEVATALIAAVGQWDEEVKDLDPKSTIFRIYRDVRFAKDKSPYKTNMGMYFSPGGKNSYRPGYYLHIEPGASFVGGGVYMPESKHLKSIRQEIDYHLDEFTGIVTAPEFVAQFGGLEANSEYKLSRPPKDYPADHPGIEFLKFKSFVATRYLKDDELTSPDLTEKCAEIFRTLQPLNQFMDRALS